MRLTALEQAIEYTHEQLSWRNKNLLGKLYLVLGYMVCLALVIVLIVIVYHETHSGDQLLSTTSLLGKIKSSNK